LLPLLLLVALAASAQAPPAPAKQPEPAKPKLGPSGAYQQAARIPARIQDFRAEPASIQPGQSAILIWRVENPTTTSIDGGIGSVTAIGSRRVTPAATTTYTLRVTGPNGELTKSVTLTVAGTQPVSGSEITTAPRPAPRMADGKPDLSGVYNSSSFNFGGRPVRGQNTPIAAKLKPGAESYRVVRPPDDPGAFSNCLPTGVPRAYYVPYQWQIVQGLNYVVIMYEYPHLFRIIPTDGTPHPVEPDPTWMGHSIGRWEGDTLVVDTVGFNDKTELPGGFRHTEALHVVERFTRVDYDNLDYVATIEDPNVFVEPWKIELGFPLRTDLTTIGEFICENNRDYTQFFEKK
jgi:hypothetical protein